METPKTANTEKKLCSLKRDNMSLSGYWILANKKHITIAKKNKSGYGNDGMITISKKVFDRFIKFYQTGKTK